MKALFGELQCLHASLHLTRSSGPAWAKDLLTLGLRICEQEKKVGLSSPQARVAHAGS